MTAVPEKPGSDRTLRRCAWAGWWFFAAMLVIGVLLASAGNEAVPLGAATFSLVVAVFPTVGLLIVRRQPRNTVGWLLMGVGLIAGLSGLADNYASYGLLVNPGSLPGSRVAAALNEGSWAPLIGSMGTFVVLLYPDGHLPSPRWRLVAWASGVSIVTVTAVITFLPGEIEEGPAAGYPNPLGWEAGQPILTVLLYVFLPMIPLCIVACAVALVRRFRRSRGVERLQLKWLATAGALVACTYLIAMATYFLVASGVISGRAAAWLSALQYVSPLSFVLLPVAIGIAILRHGLYQIDVVVNRALVYGSLTATLAGVYLTTVLLLQQVLNPLTSQSDLAVAGSTLAVAALFRPARARFQVAVDRRFYRNRYDAARTVDAYTARLRHQLDLDAVGSDLRAAVHETVQPAHVSLWVRP